MGEINITVSEEIAELIDDWSIRSAKREILREALICASGGLHSTCELSWDDSRLKQLEKDGRRISWLLRDLAELEEADEAERDGREVDARIGGENV